MASPPCGPPRNHGTATEHQADGKRKRSAFEAEDPMVPAHTSHALEEGPTNPQAFPAVLSDACERGWTRQACSARGEGEVKLRHSGYRQNPACPLRAVHSLLDRGAESHVTSIGRYDGLSALCYQRKHAPRGAVLLETFGLPRGSRAVLLRERTGGKPSCRSPRRTTRTPGGPRPGIAPAARQAPLGHARAEPRQSIHQASATAPTPVNGETQRSDTSRSEPSWSLEDSNA